MPTTNPVPSLDPSDLLFNAGRLDQVVNGSTQYYTDRLGVNRRTVEGINAAADVVLGGIGYAPPVAYAAGISMTLTTQTVEYSGEVYAPKVGNLPFTTSGTFETAKFRLIQGVAAVDLAASGGAAMVGYMPSGVGAVPTDVQTKLRETVSRAGYVTEDDFNAAKSGKVYIDDGLLGSSLATFGNGDWANPTQYDARHIVEIVNDNSPYQVFALNSYGETAFGNNVHFNRYWGTLASPSAIGANAAIMSIGYRGWDGSGVLSQSMAAFQCYTTQAWTPSAHGCKFIFAVTPNGGATRKTALEVVAFDGGGSGLNVGDGTDAFARIVNAANNSATQIHGSNDQNSAQSIWYGSSHASMPYVNQNRANKFLWESIGATEFGRFTSSGLSIGLGADASYKLHVKASGANAFNVTAANSSAMFYSTSGDRDFAAGESSSYASFVVRKESTTNRSINCAGTVNASGADYAEYEKNNGLVIGKGSIVGFKADGTLTLTYSEAVRFGIKSTDPSYVGGDTWGDEDMIGKRPEQPIREKAETDASFCVRQATYESEMAEFESALESARRLVDRVAYAGKVPVNVAGATPGDYIVAIAGDDGSITGESLSDPDFSQYKKAVGRVNRILDDGRAEVAVIVH